MLTINSMIFSLNHLDLREVQRRNFLNLRVTWGIGCSSGSINTTKVNEESGTIPEEKEMQAAFRANFNIWDIPEILATPCCSQIAVTRKAIRKNPREQYLKHVGWLEGTELNDGLSGRTWEHMWQWLFLGQAVDCPIEHKAYCRLYHICFGGREQYDEWIELNQGREKLEKELQGLSAEEVLGDAVEKNMENAKAARMQQAEEEKGWKEGNKVEKEMKADRKKQREKEEKEEKKSAAEMETKKNAREKTKRWLESELQIVKEAIRVRREVAVIRGAVEQNRMAEGEFLYGDAQEPGIEKELPTRSSSGISSTNTPLI
jgi:hypothetical protein